MTEQLTCNQNNVKFVLVRTEFLGNIGSVARVMKNFGFAQLALVQPPNNYKDAEARMMAVGAFDVLKAATVYDTMLDAVSECGTIYGTTSGRQRSQHLQSLQEASPEAIAHSNTDKIAIVFGNEKNGLDNDELARCHRLIYIPDNPQFAALNIAQALGVVAYELTRGNDFGVPPASEPKYTRRLLPTVSEEEEFFALVEQFFESIDFTRDHNRELVLNDLRRLYQRMHPNKRELDLTRGALYRLNLTLRRLGAPIKID